MNPIQNFSITYRISDRLIFLYNFLIFFYPLVLFRKRFNEIIPHTYTIDVDVGKYKGNLASERMTKLMFDWENFQKVMLSTSAELNIYVPIKTFNKICLFAATQYPKKNYIYTQMMIIM